MLPNPADEHYHLSQDPPRPDPAKTFLYAKSLSAIVALLLHLRRLANWVWLVLNGAMCVVSDKFKLSWPLKHLLEVAEAVAPTWEVVPMRGSTRRVSFNVKWKR